MMTENEKIFIEDFVFSNGEGVKYASVPEDISQKYANKFKLEKDDIDAITFLWYRHGLRSYKNGLFWTVNPDEFNNFARQFSKVSSKALVFGRSACGGLFTIDEFAGGISIFYFNIHTGEYNLVSTSMEIFLYMKLGSMEFWKKECYGKFELKVIEKYGPLAYDECYAFVPALALGGSESMKNIQKVKVKEHLEFLAQLY